MLGKRKGDRDRSRLEAREIGGMSFQVMSHKKTSVLGRSKRDNPICAAATVVGSCRSLRNVSLMGSEGLPGQGVLKGPSRAMNQHKEKPGCTPPPGHSLILHSHPISEMGNVPHNDVERRLLIPIG
jgi:hypothetical protein